MILGHYAIAFAAKSYAPRASLGTLLLGALSLDLLCAVFLVLGWEHIRIVPGLMAANSLDFQHFPISHSLLSALVVSVLLGGGYLLFRRYPRGATVLGLAVVTHWLLDVTVHRPDVPLWPGYDVHVGFGLWNSMVGTVVVELSLLGAGVLMYTRVTHPRDPTGTRALIVMVAFLVVISFIMLLVPPPPHEEVIALLGLAQWLVIPWGYWIDRQREPSRLHGPLN